MKKVLTFLFIFLSFVGISFACPFFDGKISGTCGISAELKKKFEDPKYDYIDEMLEQGRLLLENGDEEGAKKIYFEIIENTDFIPKFENTENGFKATNLPKMYRSDECRNFLKNNFLMFRPDMQPSDIFFDEDDNLTIDLKCGLPECRDCCDECRHGNLRECKGKSQSDLSFCQQNCSSCSTMAGMFVCSILPTSKCKKSCLFAVEMLRRACYKCCEQDWWESYCTQGLRNFSHYPCSEG